MSWLRRIISRDLEGPIVINEQSLKMLAGLKHIDSMSEELWAEIIRLATIGHQYESGNIEYNLYLTKYMTHNTMKE